MKRSFLMVFAFSLLASASISVERIAHADLRTFDAFTYNRLNLEKKLVVLDFHTFQCAKCRAQNPLIEKLLEQKRFANVAVLVIQREQSRKFILQFDISSDAALVFMYQKKMISKMQGHIDVPVLEQEITRDLAEINHPKAD